MARSRNFAIKLNLDSAAYLRNLRLVDAVTSRVVGTMRGALGRLAAIAAPAVVIGGLAAIARNAAEATDALGKTSDRIGVSTERLQALRIAGEQSGVEFEELARMFDTMNRNVGETFQKGTSRASDSLRELGISARDLVAMGPERAFDRIIDKLREIDNPMQRAQAAMRIFGESGAKAMSLILEGSEGIDRVQEKLSAMGVTLTRVDAKKVEMARDALSLIGKYAREIASVFLVELAPAVTVLLDEIAKLIEKQGGWRASAIDAAEAAAMTFSQVHKVISGVVLGFRVLLLQTQAMALVMNGIATLANNITGIGDAELLRRMDNAIFDALAANLEEINRLASELGQQGGMKEFFEKWRASADKADAAIKDSINSIGEFTVKASDKLKRFADIWDAQIDRAADTLAEFIVTGRGDFGDFVQSLIQEWVKFILQTQIFDKLKSLSGGGGIIGSIGKILGFAEGGRPPVGRASLVGERGPELFVPDTSGTIVPMDERPAGRSGIVLQMVYHIASGVTKAELGPILQAHSMSVQGQLADVIARGGNRARAFAR